MNTDSRIGKPLKIRLVKPQIHHFRGYVDKRGAWAAYIGMIYQPFFTIRG